MSTLWLLTLDVWWERSMVILRWWFRMHGKMFVASTLKLVATQLVLEATASVVLCTLSSSRGGY